MSDELRMVTHGRVAELWLGTALFGLLHAEEGGVVLRLESVPRGQRIVNAAALERALAAAAECLVGAHEPAPRVHAPPAAEPFALEEFIADVLHVACRTGRTGVPEIAELFADQLGEAHPRFDRARFIDEVTGHALAVRT